MIYKNRGFIIVMCIALFLIVNPILADQEKISGEIQDNVKSIDWSHFTKSPETENAKMLKELLSKSSHYLVPWLGERAQKPLPKNKEVPIRSLAFNASTLAILLRTGIYNEQYGGLSKEKAEQLVWSCVERLCTDHKANGGVWGDHWQSSLWASFTAEAGWLCRDSGKKEDRQKLVKMLIHEADRIANIDPPCWNGKGGNSRAEENGWDAFIVEIASQMLPDHPRSKKWQQQAIRYRLNAVATKKDLESEEKINGAMVKNWVRGFNLMDTGAIVNHGVNPHPNYSGCQVSQPGRGSLFYALAGNPVPLANRYNGKLVYNCMVAHKWESPPYAEPGGTILSVDGTIYWPPPDGKEKERAKRNSRWSAFGIFASVMGIDEDTNIKAKKLAGIFIRKALTHQSEDGTTGEQQKEREYNPLHLFAHCYLALWLKENNTIRFTNNSF